MPILLISNTLDPNFNLKSNKMFPVSLGFLTFEKRPSSDQAMCLSKC